MVCNKKRKPVFIKRKWNHVVFSRATILSFHPVKRLKLPFFFFSFFFKNDKLCSVIFVFGRNLCSAAGMLSSFLSPEALIQGRVWEWLLWHEISENTKPNSVTNTNLIQIFICKVEFRLPQRTEFSFGHSNSEGKDFTRNFLPLNSNRISIDIDICKLASETRK